MSIPAKAPKPTRSPLHRSYNVPNSQYPLHSGYNVPNSQYPLHRGYNVPHSQYPLHRGYNVPNSQYLGCIQGWLEGPGGGMDQFRA